MSVTVDLHRIGLHWWPATYGPRANAHELERMMDSIFQSEGSEKEATGIVEMACRAADWVHGGCRIIDSDADYIDAMTMTDAAPSVRDGLRIPWPSFLVRIPRGSILREHCDAIFLSESRTLFGRNLPSTIQFMHEEHNRTSTLAAYATPLVETLFRDANDPTSSALSVLAERAIIGLLFTMQHTIHFKDGSRNSGVSRRPLRNEPPPHRSIVIGRPINFRAKPSDSHGATGEGTPPAFQTMVRGHIKRQVVGPGGTGRKVVWIEPYWRGPEDAPILARPYLVGSA